MPNEEMVNKEDIEKLLSDIYKKKVIISKIEQKQNCLIASNASTELHVYKDADKQDAQGYESFADIYVIPINNGELSKKVVMLKEQSYQIRQNEWEAGDFYEIDPTTEIRVYNSKKELVAYMEEQRYRDLLKESRFDLFGEGVGHPLYFSKRLLNELESETGPSPVILREAEYLYKIGRYSTTVLSDLKNQARMQNLIKNGDEIARLQQEKDEALRRKMEETVNRIEYLRQLRQRELESKNLPKIIKKIGKAGIDIDSRIQTVVAMKKMEK